MNLDIEELRFSYREKPVLDGITLNIVPGEVIGIIGPNGCGKTTLLKHLNRNLDPNTGRVLLDGTDIEEMTKSEIARHIAVVPQSNEINFSFTVRDIVTMGRMPFLERFQGESSGDMEKVEDAMKKANILDFADRYINTMSGGERQRVIIARALAQTPEIILLDEPTLHLDISNQFDVLDLVKKLSDDDGLTVVIVSHDLSMVVRYCDRIVMLKDQRIFAIGEPEKVLTPENMKDIFNVDAVLEKDTVTGQNTVRLFGSCTKQTLSGPSSVSVPSPGSNAGPQKETKEKNAEGTKEQRRKKRVAKDSRPNDNIGHRVSVNGSVQDGAYVKHVAVLSDGSEPDNADVQHIMPDGYELQKKKEETPPVRYEPVTFPEYEMVWPDDVHRKKQP